MNKDDKQTLACHISVILENLSVINKALDEHITNDAEAILFDRLMERVYLRLEEMEDILNLWHKPDVFTGQFDAKPFHYDTICNCDSCKCRRADMWDPYEHRMD